MRSPDLRLYPRLRLSFASLVTTLCASVVCPAAMHAQQMNRAPRPIRFVVTGGATIPQGRIKKLNDTGLHASGSLLVSLMGLTLRPELSLTRFQHKDISALVLTGGGGTTPTGNTQMLAAMGNLEFPLLAGLYVLAGVGLQNLATTTNDVKSSDANVMVNAGAGFRFHMGRIEGFGEARVGTASYSAGKVGYSKAQLIPVSFGLAF